MLITKTDEKKLVITLNNSSLAVESAVFCDTESPVRRSQWKK